MRRPQAKKSLPLVTPSQPEWKIEKLVPGGAGFARLANGQGAFVSGALPGERISVTEAEDHGTYLQASRWSLLEASLERVEPACPVQSRCGGCDLMTLEYRAQLAAKVALLQDALSRIGGFRALPTISVVPSSDATHYRSRIRLHVAVDGRLGFFSAGTRELVEVPTCLVAHDALNEALSQLRVVAHHHRTEMQMLRELELRVAPSGPRLSLHLIPAQRPFRGARLSEALSKSFHVTVADHAADPDQDQRFPLPGGVELRAPGGAFTQVNWEVNRALVGAVVDGSEHRGVRRFLDLYCGAGNFSLPLFARGMRGLGIEAARDAVRAAQRAAAEQHVAGAEFIAADVRGALAELPVAADLDLVLLDPPRSGAREIMAEVRRRAPRHVAYCACDPVTLARDLRSLCEAGYVLESVALFDMFPQTHHFETLAWLHASS